MSKFFRKLIPLLFVGFVCSTTFGLSYFYLQEKRSTDSTISNDANNKIKNDDIKENYNFGKNSSTEGKTYTIYFFPSASYLHLFHEYITNATSVKPEDQFGYKEVQYNDDGSLSTDSNGNVKYKLSENTGKVTYDGATSSYGEVTYDGAYRRYMGELFNTTVFEADGGNAYGSTDKDGNGTPYTETQNVTETVSGGKRTWGMPNDGLTFATNDPDKEEHFNGRNQYSSDRLGCWGDDYYYGQTVKDDQYDGAPTGLIKGDGVHDSVDGMDDTNTGRYIPIKITVTNEFTSSLLEKVIPEVFTSMGSYLNANIDYKYFHNFTFTEWTYVTNPDNPSDSDYPYSYDVDNPNNQYVENDVGEAFQPKPSNTYFDLHSDLDKYADKNGVIRLYPLFNNGKKTSSSSFDNGGGSSERLKITDSTSTASGEETTTTTTSEYKYPLLHTDTYNDGTGSFTYKNSSGEDTTEDLLTSKYIRLFSFNNIKVGSTTSKLEFAANNVWNSAGNWNVDSNKLLWRNLYVLDSNYIQKNLVSTYGEGLYTFYMIVANYSYQNGPSESSSNSLATMKGTFDTFFNNMASQAIEKFSSLNGKHIVQITSDALDYTDDKDHDYSCSPTVIVFEKIDEPKLMSTSTDPSNNLSTFVTDNYNNGRSFYKNVNPLYVGSDNGNSTFSATGNDLSASSPYTYLIKNIDLTEDNYFVISLNSNSNSTIKFNTDANTMEYSYLISNPNSTTAEIKEEDVFTKPFDYISMEETSAKDGLVFKLNSNCNDIYDFLIKYNETESKYDVYMRRHGQLFCYIYDKNLSDIDTDGFVKHSWDASTYKTSDGASLIYSKEYIEGTSISSSDTPTYGYNNSSTLEACIKARIDQDSGTIVDYLSYRLIDRVTGEKVAWFEKETDSSGNTTYTLKCNLTMNKNHILYLDKIA